jgi:hypothetical protein
MRLAAALVALLVAAALCAAVLASIALDTLWLTDEAGAWALLALGFPVLVFLASRRY